ncbi:hypothetical protein BU23DRAFT_196755 [Bimuria novae-zelandiae CBS 107.79]|uniref:Uncharacterized protein n=1 Tax=Bimuria novae-zelandiae CBS 107.79 TaxID=1447943 RepID=A0A6A5V2I2_9PLEO|nr:hypothetical protein BU23DRAFT_196755 [Bimuria novae-zelandiae CBS 107.79]
MTDILTDEDSTRRITTVSFSVFFSHLPSTAALVRSLPDAMNHASAHRPVHPPKFARPTDRYSQGAHHDMRVKPASGACSHCQYDPCSPVVHRRALPCALSPAQPHASPIRQARRIFPNLERLRRQHHAMKSSLLGECDAQHRIIYTFKRYVGVRSTPLFLHEDGRENLIMYVVRWVGRMGKAKVKCGKGYNKC